MENNPISKISNAFSTGGGGTNFEHQVQAMFLMLLLVEGFCPVINEKIKRICFQGKHLGIDTDDVVVYTNGEQAEGKLLCQIKHNIVASEKDKTFKTVICSAWNDFNKESFDKSHDKIVLATAQISKTSSSALSWLHEQAIFSKDENEFLDRINILYYSSKGKKIMFMTIKNIVSTIEDSLLTNFEIWNFFKVFTILLFDLDCKESINRTLSTCLIKCNSSLSEDLIWSKLVDYASICNQNAASIELKNFDEKILCYFSIKKKIFQIPPAPIENSDLFIPMITMIGSWKESNKYDCEIISYICGIEYSEFEKRARTILIQYSDYIQLEKGCWKVLHKEQLLDQCKEIIFDDYIIRLIDATKKVLSQNSKQVLCKDSYYISSGNEYDNSAELRSSLVDSCCWINKKIGDLSNCNHQKIKNNLSLLVNDLLSNTKWTTWANLRDCLERLAEISPNTYLEKIEWNILNNKEEVLYLFPKKEDRLFFSSNYITSLICSLEILAWSPDYLVKSICTLGLLESLPYEKTNWANTPINSMVSILLPWYPQTLGDLEKRKNALRCLKNDNLEVCWKVLIRLLPGYTSNTSGNPKPKYMNLNIPTEISVTTSEVYECYDFLMDFAVDLVENQRKKQIYLVTQIKYMHQSTLMKFLDHVENNIVEYDENESFFIWHKFREELIDSKLKEKLKSYNQLDRIQALIDQLEPKDIRLKYKELFLEHKSIFVENDKLTQWDILENKKINAIREIYDLYGIEEVEKFGHSINNISDVGNKLGKSLSKDELTKALSCYSLNKLSKIFMSQCIISFTCNNGAQELSSIPFEQIMAHDSVLKLLSTIPFSLELYKVVKKYISDDNEYFEIANMSFFLFGDELNEIEMITDKLISSKRYVAAVNLVGRSDFENYCNVHHICKLLNIAGTKNSIGNECFDNYAIEKIFDWLHKQKNIEIKKLSNLEFIYLPILIKGTDVLPKALYSRLSLDVEYFCSLIELFYKKKTEKKHSVKINDAVGERFSHILFNYNVVPGIDYNGKFHTDIFINWMNKVKEWSKDNERYEVTMQTVGSGLAYAELDEHQLPNRTIVEELNKADNNELRKGYYLGIINKRGVYTVDPEGKPELQLAKEYADRAEIAEKEGYFRYANIFVELSNEYKIEAEKIIAESNEDNEM